MSTATEAPPERVEEPVRQVPAGRAGTLARAAAWVALAAITAGAAALRFAHLGQVIGDPFYDGAVRSMGLSWHNFFFGAVEPSGAIAIDKPPVDLWLQVASVKLLGFGSAALKTPEALAGTLAVPLLYAAVRPVFGVRAGLASRARARAGADRGDHRAQRHDGRGDDGADRARAGAAGAGRAQRAHRSGCWGPPPRWGSPST